MDKVQLAHQERCYNIYVKQAKPLGLDIVKADDFPENPGYCRFIIIDEHEDIIFHSDFIRDISTFLAGMMYQEMRSQNIDFLGTING